LGALYDEIGGILTFDIPPREPQLARQAWKVIRIWQLPSAVYAALRYQLVAAATYPRLRLRFSTPFPE
jgi:hypothetical protein